MCDWEKGLVFEGIMFCVLVKIWCGIEEDLRFVLWKVVSVSID